MMAHQIAERSKLIRDKALYPDSDGKPISDNTLQFLWISMLKPTFLTPLWTLASLRWGSNQDNEFRILF